MVINFMRCVGASLVNNLSSQKKIEFNFTSRLALIGLFFCIHPINAATTSVDWDNSDSSPDGDISGSLGGIVVNVDNGSTMLSVYRNGGRFFSTDWSANLGSDGVSGIGGSGVLAEGATLDMGGAGYATTTITFSQTVSNPTLLFNFVDNVNHQWLFSSLMPLLSLTDKSIVNPIIGAGNQVTINSGEGNNTDDAGFSLQFTGDFDSIAFDSSPGINGATPQSVGFTVLADVVPEPSSFTFLLFGLFTLLYRRRGINP